MLIGTDEDCIKAIQIAAVSLCMLSFDNLLRMILLHSSYIRGAPTSFNLIAFFFTLFVYMAVITTMMMMIMRTETHRD